MGRTAILEKRSASEAMSSTSKTRTYEATELGSVYRVNG